MRAKDAPYRRDSPESRELKRKENAELKRENAELGKENAELKRENAELGKENAEFNVPTSLHFLIFLASNRHGIEAFQDGFDFFVV